MNNGGAAVDGSPCGRAVGCGSIAGVEASSARERMLAGLPAARGILDAAGSTTSYWEFGDGPPILLLHGGIECGGAMWAPVAMRLAERYRLVVPDLPGLGESTPVERLDLTTFVRWMIGLLDQTRLHRPILVAHSLVGSLAARFAIHRSDTLGQLVIYSAPAIATYRLPMQLRYLAIRFAIRPTARNSERFNRFALYDLDATRHRDPDWYDAFDAYTRRQAALPHVKKAMNQLVAHQTTQIPGVDLDRITIRTELLWGRHDRMVPLAVASDAAARHGWPLRVVEGAGHAPHIERPDAFVDELERTVGAPRSPRPSTST